MHARRCATRHQYQVAIDFPWRDASAPIDHREFDAADSATTAGSEHNSAFQDLEAGTAGRLGQCTLCPLAQLGDPCDFDAGRPQVQCRAIGAIGRRHDHGTGTCAHAVAIEIAANGAGQHDSGPVVVRENERLLDRAGREYDFARAHLPQALA